MSFNTLKYTEELEGAGVPHKQAAVHAETLLHAIEDSMVTKDYLDARFDAQTAERQSDIKDIGLQVTAQVSGFESKLGQMGGKLDAIDTKLNAVIWVGGLSLTGIGGLFVMMFQLMAQFN